MTNDDPEGPQEAQSAAVEDEVAPDSAHTIARRQLLRENERRARHRGMRRARGPRRRLHRCASLSRRSSRMAPGGQGRTFQSGRDRQRRVHRRIAFALGGRTAKTSAWLRRLSEDEFVAFSVNCSHLGCPVRWIREALLFMCPCHGGVYYEDGRVAAGPPPHPLTRYPVRIQNGEVAIRADPIPIG